jgi:uncharacterized FlaG/YvyC family protein
VKRLGDPYIAYRRKMKNIEERVTELESKPNSSEELKEMKEHIEALEDIIENKLGFRIHKKFKRIKKFFEPQTKEDRKRGYTL